MVSKKCISCGEILKYQKNSRVLCQCESGRCFACKAQAMGVNFLVDISSVEPFFSEKGKTVLFCYDHAPKDFATKDVLETKEEKKIFLSPGATSSFMVQCIHCKCEHKLMERKNWSGSFSDCPKCKESVWVHAGGYSDKELGLTPNDIKELNNKKKDILFSYKRNEIKNEPEQGSSRENSGADNTAGKDEDKFRKISDRRSN